MKTLRGLENIRSIRHLMAWRQEKKHVGGKQRENISGKMIRRKLKKASIMP